MTLPVMRSPRHVDVQITGQCNLHCTYCSHFTSASDVPEELPMDVWREFFHELERATVMRITFSGGEPFIRPDFLPLLTWLESRPLRFSVLTNGTLIDIGEAKTLATLRHLDYLQVSLDGADEEAHDPFRGTGSFKCAYAGIEALLHAGITPLVRVTIHRRNVAKLPTIAHFLLEDLGLPSFATNSASHMGLCRHNATLTQLTPDEYTLAIELLTDLAARYPGRISATAGPLADGIRWKMMDNARNGRGEAPPDGGFLTGCHGPFQTLAVRADGIMIPCQQLGHLPLGRINQDDLLAIWQHHRTLLMLRERQHIPLTSFPFCRTCPYLRFCTGNCPATAYTRYGDINHPSPEGCLRLFLDHGGHLSSRETRRQEGSNDRTPA